MTAAFLTTLTEVEARDGEAGAITEIVSSDWVRQNHEKIVRAWAYREGLLPRP